ncbi:MAG: hypothetical protein EZS28_029399 [Streblomastix strix]|uniref:Uncharacterized protein n=1 Tax=Streblomastix strix TaxID=222440 RepID=A0A5J4UZB1_9EUKA|nr:MAG: hypothetical protein EZS28_029399 [Streblomastix strix]
MNNHINEEEDREAQIFRDSSGLCLGQIQKYGDEYTQSELVSSEYAVVQVLLISTAGGDGGEKLIKLIQVLHSHNKQVLLEDQMNKQKKKEEMKKQKLN